jgi:hypothetical protein
VCGWSVGAQTRCNNVSYCATSARAVNPHTWLSVVLDGLRYVDVELPWTLGSGNVDIGLAERQTEIPVAHGLLQAGSRSGNKHTQWQQCLCKSEHDRLLVLRTVYRSQMDETAAKGQPLSDVGYASRKNGSQAQNRNFNEPQTDIETARKRFRTPTKARRSTGFKTAVAWNAPRKNLTATMGFYAVELNT